LNKVHPDTIDMKEYKRMEDDLGKPVATIKMYVENVSPFIT